MTYRHSLNTLIAAAAVVVACGKDVTAPIDPPPDPAAAPESALVLDSFYAVTIPTYEGSGQLTEPSAIRFDSIWNGWRYWMAFVPSPYTSEQYEKPSIVVSQNGRVWRVPAGASNPIDTASELSDPTIAFDSAAGVMRLYYRHYFVSDDILVASSRDGVHWSKGGTLLHGGLGTLVQPAVTRGPGGWEMWTVDANLTGAPYPYYPCSADSSILERRHAANGLTFGAPDTVPLVLPGYILWHVDVRYARGRYWALVAAYPVGSDCGHTVEFLSSSADAISWTTTPVSTGSLFVRQAYKSAIVVRDSTVQLWLTGTDSIGAWHTYLKEIAAP